jgi:hypothetical protein
MVIMALHMFTVWFCMTFYTIYMLFIRQLLSRYRGIPTAKQPAVLRRLFHEPTTFELQTWMHDTPNDGLIRYFGFLNQERLLMTDLETIKQVLQRDALKFDKLTWLASLQTAAGVSGLVTSKGEIHKVVNLLKRVCNKLTRSRFIGGS